MDLEQDVAELVEQLGVVAGVRGGGKLVGLLDRVRDDRALVLLAVPGALPAQPPRELVEAHAPPPPGPAALAHFSAVGAGVGCSAPVDVAVAGFCGTAPGAVVGVALGFGAFLQSCVV